MTTQVLAADFIHHIALHPAVEGFFTSRGPEAREALPYSGFSLCHYTGDDASHVTACRRALAMRLGIPPGRIILPRQTHSTRALEVTSRVTAAELEGVDAVVTREAALCIGVSTADCVPVLLADGEAGVIAAAHAGWRGAIGGIVQCTVSLMQQLGADAARIRAALGPGICGACFEVGQEVAELFPEQFVSARESLKAHVDLPGYVAASLKALGIRSVRMPQACTRCHPAELFSARAHGVASGRLYTAIMLRP